MSDWKITRVSQMAEILSGGTPKTEVEEYWNGNIPWLSVKDFAGDTRKVYASEKHISELGLNNSATQLLHPGDIIISARGTVGEVAQIGKTAAFNQSCYGLRATGGYSSDYLYYMLKYQVRYLKSVANGAVFDTIVVKTFDRMKASVPDLPTQARIADILSAYDDLIENNNRRIALLEKAAQELYKEWFVRFRFPGYETAKFENGLPTGWEIKKIGDIARIKSGYAFKSEWWSDEGVPVIKIKDIQNTTIDFSDLSRVSEVHALLAKQFFVTEGDLLIAMTGATIGKLALVPFSSERLVVNQRVGKFFLGDNPVSTVSFLYCTLQQNWIQELILMIASSNAAQPNISPFDIEKIKIIYNENVVAAFNKKASDYISQILLLNKKNQNLAKQRDLILPRLMSGKLEV